MIGARRPRGAGSERRRTTQNSLTAGRGDGELPRDDEVGAQHEDEADGEGDVEVALRPGPEAPPGLHLAAHRPLALLPPPARSLSPTVQCPSGTNEPLADDRCGWEWSQGRAACLARAFSLSLPPSIPCLHGREGRVKGGVLPVVQCCWLASSKLPAFVVVASSTLGCVGINRLASLFRRIII